jgi:hypothetical protein
MPLNRRADTEAALQAKLHIIQLEAKIKLLVSSSAHSDATADIRCLLRKAVYISSLRPHTLVA